MYNILLTYSELYITILSIYFSILKNCYDLRIERPIVQNTRNEYKLMRLRMFLACSFPIKLIKIFLRWIRSFLIFNLNACSFRTIRGEKIIAWVEVSVSRFRLGKSLSRVYVINIGRGNNRCARLIFPRPETICYQFLRLTQDERFNCLAAVHPVNFC